MINTFSDLLNQMNDIKPLSIIRMGNVEASQLLYKKGIYSKMLTNAGFFGDEKALTLWKNQMLDALMNADCNLRVVSCRSFFVCDDVLTKLNLHLPTLPYVEELSYWVSFINKLKSTSIGIISYFAEEMKSQIKIIDRVFNNRIKYTKSMDSLNFIFSENTIQGNEPDNKTFQEVFDDLLKRSLEADCDVYLISCGCYGIPLCNELKKNGKRAIYVGGILQLLFGLKGKRWDERPEISQHYNKHWKYPSKKPINADLVEGSCYWGSK